MCKSELGGSAPAAHPVVEAQEARIPDVQLVVGPKHAKLVFEDVAWASFRVR
jgi:hypothetical protein